MSHLTSWGLAFVNECPFSTAGYAFAIAQGIGDHARLLVENSAGQPARPNP